MLYIRNPNDHNIEKEQQFYLYLIGFHKCYLSKTLDVGKD